MTALFHAAPFSRLMRHTFAAILAVLFATVPVEASAQRNANVLELRGQHLDVRRPDIIFLAPLPTAPAEAYAKPFDLAEAKGVTLPNATLTAADFHSGGALSILKAADYRFRYVRGLSWKDAGERIASMIRLRRETRVEEGLDLDPLCVILIEKASPEDLEATLPALLESDALLFLAPQRDLKLPLIVAWRNVFWPGHHDMHTIRPDHWIPTLADVVGLPPPAENDAVSIFPILSSVGHQRPLEPPPSPDAMLDNTRAYTMFSHFEGLLEECNWVPDFTDSVALRPLEWAFLPDLLPLPASTAVPLRTDNGCQGYYVRALQESLDLTFPPGVSVVIRVDGRPVFSVWEPQEASHWRFASPTPRPIEIFIVTQPGFKAADLPIFQQPTTPTTT